MDNDVTYVQPPLCCGRENAEYLVVHRLGTEPMGKGLLNLKPLAVEVGCDWLAAAQCPA